MQTVFAALHRQKTKIHPLILQIFTKSRLRNSRLTFSVLGVT